MKSEIILETARLFCLTPEQITGPRRLKMITPARFALYKALRLRGWTLPQIGRFLGRDHSTVSEGISRADAIMLRDQEYALKVATIASWSPQIVTAEAA